MELEGALEGLLFVAGDEGLTTTKIKEILKINDEELKRIILSLQNQYCDVQKCRPKVCCREYRLRRNRRVCR